MNTRRFGWCTALVLVGFCTLGCEDTKNPLSDAQKAQPDPRLTGVWRLLGDGKEVTYYHIGGASENLPAGVMRVVSVGADENGRLQTPGQYLLFPTKLGEATYLNLVEAKEDQIKQLEENGWNPALLGYYFLFKYKLEGNSLSVWPVDHDAKRKVVETKKLRGTIERRENDTQVRFTDSTENLARFVAASGDSLFSRDVVRLERVK